MKILGSLTFICLLTICSVNAQSKKQQYQNEFNRAEKIFSDVYRPGKVERLNYSKGAFAEALPLILNLYNKHPGNMNLAFKLGVCYMNSRQEMDQTIYYLNKAVSYVSAHSNESSYKEKKAPIMTFYFLAEAYHLDYQFNNAMDAYEDYIALSGKYSNGLLVEEAIRKIEMCKRAKSMVANPVKVKIENMGSAINSSYADYSPVLSADQNTLFFTSRRQYSTGGEKDDEGNYMEDIYTAHKTETGWSKAENISDSINTSDHEATVGLSPDGQTILIYKDDLGDGNIYTTSLKGDEWSAPVKLNENINSKYWEPSAAISADGTILYFSSDRPGGYGGRDLYTSKLTPKGDWSLPINMGAVINTPYDEDAPFISPDGKRLSFSSNGHKTMGGFDIFNSHSSENGTWLEPKNVGYPVNTTDDDIYYVESPNGLNAYFSSFRKDGFGEKDNYMATFLDRKEVPVTLLTGCVTDKSEKPAQNVEITVADNETEHIVGMYRTNNKTGKYLFMIPPGKNYNITYQSEGYLFHSENMDIAKETNYYEIKQVIVMDTIVVGAKAILKNIFFDFDKATLRTISNVEINNLITIMNKYPKMKVEISGHTDNLGNAVYNQKLSEERSQAVAKRLIESGISKDRITVKGFGEKNPAVNNLKDDGTDNKEARQFNRRVEFKIIEMK